MRGGPRSLHVVSSLSLASGGPTESVPRLCEHLNRLGAPAEIATIASTDDRTWEGLTAIHRFPLGAPAKLRRSAELRDFLMDAAPGYDLIHVHGLWEWPGCYARRAAQRHDRPLVISPRGMLEPWAMAHRRAFKSVALRLWEARNLRTAAFLHATSDLEAHSLRTFSDGPIEVIPNGIEAPAPPASRPPDTMRKMVFLSRYHPKKGLPFLIEAWGNLHASFPDWILVLHGPDPDGHLAQMREHARRLGIPEARIRFNGPVHGQAKWDLLAGADLMVLPTHSENFGNVVLEALSQGTPVITTQGTPWSSLVEQECGWWVPVGTSPLQAALEEAMRLPRESLLAMGRRGATWVTAAFHWDAVAERMARAYRTLLSNTP